MLSVKVGLVDTTGEIDRQTMAAVAAALNVQVTRDLPQFWPVTASVSYLPNPHQIPQGVWPVQLVKNLPPGEGGFHQTRHGQPYAKVIAGPDSDEWTVDASHETVEMLVDPSGNRLQTSMAIGIVGGRIQDIPGRYEYLVEACDPCEADAFTYEIDGIRVSDFLTPHFYDPAPTPGTRYSFNGGIQKPRQIREGGYISFVNPQSAEVQQILWVDPGSPPEEKTLGPARGLSLRLLVENHTHHMVHQKRAKPTADVQASRRAYREALAAAAEARAKHYR